jgi:CYTH domain-containing protein
MWEVDVFEGHHEGLIMAEVEMSSVDEEVVLPSWVGREVSDDDRYANASLSRTPGVPD